MWAGRGREEQLAFLADLELGFQHPGKGRWDRDDAASILLAVVGLRPLEDLALVGGAADLECLALEGFVAQGQHLPSLRPQSVKTRP